jgi:hypothetical protein
MEFDGSNYEVEDLELKQYKQLKHGSNGEAFPHQLVSYSKVIADYEEALVFLSDLERCAIIGNILFGQEYYPVFIFDNDSNRGE